MSNKFIISTDLEVSGTVYTTLINATTISATTINSPLLSNYLPTSGGTVSGGTNFTSGLTANTVTLSTTPTTNTTDSSVLVRNSTTGNIEVRSINNLINENNTVTVALTGSTGVDFNSIKAAVNSITGATSANTYSVKVAGGVYNEDPFTIPSWVSVVGESSLSTIIQANNPNQTLINLSDQSALFDCQVQGCTGTSVSAIVYSSSTTPQSSAISYVENVRFGSNYTHAKVVAYGGANVIMQCSNVKYGGYPFTIGFYATNSGSGIGRMQLRNVTSTNGGIATTTGLIFAKADAASCGFIVNGCLLTKAAGAAAGTGFYVENGGFLRLTAVNFQRWAVGIDAPQIGVAPSIDAIALNFENNTIDVNIAHSGATGKIQGTDNFLKTIINPNCPLYEVNQDPKEIVVAKKGGDFSSIKSAVDYLIASGNTSSTNRYVISVGPGEFTEGEIDLRTTPYVSIVGSSIQTTLIKPSGATQHIINVGVNNEISFLTLSGASSGYAGIYCYDIGIFSIAHKISFYDCDTNIWVESDTQDTQFFAEFVDFNGIYTYGTKVIGNNSLVALANMENYYNFPTSASIVYCNYVSGRGATLSVFVGDAISNGVSGSTAYYIQDDASFNASTITCDGFTYGIRNPNIGDPIRFDVDNASLVNGEWDLYIERASTFGTFGGSSSHEKLYTNSTDVYWSFLDIEDGEFDITRKISITFEDGTHTDTSTLIFQGGTMGLISGGTIVSLGGLSAQTASGYGYLQNTGTQIYQRIDWTDSTIVLSPNTNNYLYINSSSILSASNTSPENTENIIVGRVVTNASTIEFIDESPLKASHTSNLFSTFNRTALGPVYASGSIVTQNGTAFKINVSGGDYFFSENQFMPSGGSGITFTQYYRNGGGGWNTSATTFVQSTSFDNNGTLSGLTTSAFTKHTLYVVGDGSYEKYFLVLGQTQYTTLVQAEGADLPTPPTFFNDAVTSIASIYIQQGASNIIQFEDIRPVIGFKAGGVNASSLHANLLGLTADDHQQYLLVDGGRAMSGNLDMGGNEITNSGNINGVTIENHRTRHLFGGDDEVGTTTPTANAIPFADVSGTLDSWISNASFSTSGKVKLSFNPISSTEPIAVGQNDTRFQSSFTGASYVTSTGILTFNYVSGGTRAISGFNFTGGTVTGATNFTAGLTANTISATTYNNLPVSGLTQGTNITITNNGSGNYTINSTGGGGSFTGGTVTGPTNFTGGLSANTISATTYLNLSSGNLASAQARRTTGFNLPASVSFITLDVTDVENIPSVISHDNVNTERIYIYSTGLYLIHYHADVGPGTVSDFEFSVLKNALTTISGSIISGKNSSTDKVAAGVDTLVLLNANDYVSLYGRYVGTSTGIANNVVLSVTKMEGVVGPQGPSLTGGTIVGATNFTGGLSANTFSASTYQGNVVTQIVAGTNVTISPLGGTGVVTINSTGGGGGGTPGGTVNEVQYNDGAGGFGGAGNVEINSGNLKLVSTADPSAPTGGIISYSKVVGGRHLPKIIGPSGVDTVMQVGLHGNSVMMTAPANGTTPPTVWGGVLTTTATISHQQTIASVNPWQATRRTRFQTSTTAGNATGMRTAYVQWFRGSATGFGGFWFRAQLGMNINLNGGQKFVGLCASTGVLGGEPSALLNMCGMGYDSTDLSTGNWQFMYNDGTGTATKVDLGTNAARNTLQGYDLVMFMAPGGSELFVRIVNLSTNVTVLETSYTTLLPVANTGMAFKAEVRNGAVAANDNLEIAKVYIESDY